MLAWKNLRRSMAAAAFLITSLFPVFLTSNTETLEDYIIRLHTSTSGTMSNVIWRECGKSIRSVANVRASEYSSMILNSCHDIFTRYSVEINPIHVAAVLYLESSMDECVVGRKELGRFSVTGKKSIMGLIKRWTIANGVASKSCRGKSGEDYSKCVDDSFSESGSDFVGIHGWDIGVAQYRFPGIGTTGRTVIMPDGRSVKVTIASVMYADVGIQMLVEDLAMFKRECSSHSHYVVRDGKKTKLSVEESYFVHHHVGINAWSEKYWKNIIRILKM